MAITVTLAWVEPDHPQLSIARLCELLGLPRSTYYYCSHRESPENLHVMRLLDKKYTETPYYGIRRMTAWLQSEGYNVNHIPPDLVVKCQSIDNAEVNFQQLWRRTVVHTACRHRIWWCEPLSPLQAHRFTTKSRS